MKLVLLLALVGSISCNFRDHANRLYIGTATLTYLLDSNSQYRELTASQFNCLTPGNEMKVDATEPNQGQFNFAAGDELVAFAQQNGMCVRGHTLVWHSQLPDWVNYVYGDSLRAAMENHIATVMGHYQGSIYAWDVVNEAFNEDGSLRESPWHTAMGDYYIQIAFQAARNADPNAKLYINDYNVEGINAKSNGLYNLVSSLKSQGVPIDGVGFQSHFVVGSVPNDLQANLQRFADLGVDVAITELDIGNNGQSDDAQAQAYTFVIQACLAVSRCVGVTIWGVADADSWRADTTPLPFDWNYQAKAAAWAIEAALQ